MHDVRIEALSRSQRREAVRVFTDAYLGDSEFRTEFWKTGTPTAKQLDRLFASACAFQYAVHEPLAIVSPAGVHAVANYTTPTHRARASPLLHWSARIEWLRLRAALPRSVERRMKTYTETVTALLPRESMVFVSQLAVSPEAQGFGLSLELLEAIRQIANGDPKASGVGITTYSRNKAEIYARAGFEVCGTVETSRLNGWALFAPNATAA